MGFITCHIIASQVRLYDSFHKKKKKITFIHIFCMKKVTR